VVGTAAGWWGSGRDRLAGRGSSSEPGGERLEEPVAARPEPVVKPEPDAEDDPS
jgi:hypothetical protein